MDVGQAVEFGRKGKRAALTKEHSLFILKEKKKVMLKFSSLASFFFVLLPAGQMLLIGGSVLNPN